MELSTRRTWDPIPSRSSRTWSSTIWTRPGARHMPIGDLLLLGTSTVPIDDVDQLPGILAELELKLTLFVDDQLGSRVKHAAALLLIFIVQINFASGQIEGFALGVVVGFTESDPAVGGEPDLATGWCGNQGNVVEVIAKGTIDGKAANWLHLGERVDQTLVLVFF